MWYSWATSLGRLTRIIGELLLPLWDQCFQYKSKHMLTQEDQKDGGKYLSFPLQIPLGMRCGRRVEFLSGPEGVLFVCPQVERTRHGTVDRYFSSSCRAMSLH